MEQTEGEHAQETAPAGTPRELPAGRLRAWSAAVRAEGQRLAGRAEAERAEHRSVDAVYEMVDRDADVGGGIIACAIAYRLFIWLVPLALVVVAGLGIAADASSGSPEEAASLVLTVIAFATGTHPVWAALAMAAVALVTSLAAAAGPLGAVLFSLGFLILLLGIGLSPAYPIPGGGVTTIGSILLAGAPTGDIAGWAGRRVLHVLAGCAIAVAATYLFWPRDTESEAPVPAPT